jgi:hypothetical protein
MRFIIGTKTRMKRFFTLYSNHCDLSFISQIGTKILLYCSNGLCIPLSTELFQFLFRMKFPTVFFIVTTLLAMTSIWFSSFSRHCSGLLVLPFKLPKSILWEIGRFLFGIFLNMFPPVLKVSGLHTNFAKISGVKQEKSMTSITMKCANILH